MRLGGRSHRWFRARLVPGSRCRDSLAGDGLLRLRHHAGRARLLRLRAWLRLRQGPARHRRPDPAARFRGGASSTRPPGERSTSATPRSRTPTSSRRSSGGRRVPAVTSGIGHIVTGTATTTSPVRGVERRCLVRGPPVGNRPGFAGYQSSKGYGSQTADAASDMEPSWDGASITEQLGTATRRRGGRRTTTLPADGSRRAEAQKAPATTAGSERRGLRLESRARAALPEMYYAANANQWTSCGSGGPPTRVSTPPV